MAGAHHPQQHATTNAIEQAGAYHPQQQAAAIYHQEQQALE
jgi:hypothetical protein